MAWASIVSCIETDNQWDACKIMDTGRGLLLHSGIITSRSMLNGYIEAFADVARATVTPKSINVKASPICDMSEYLGRRGTISSLISCISRRTARAVPRKPSARYSTRNIGLIWTRPCRTEHNQHWAVMMVKTKRDATFLCKRTSGRYLCCLVPECSRLSEIRTLQTSDTFWELHTVLKS